eukprot:scaffold143241_cov25-Tisochrysis_lutea.AAC.1
MASSPPDLKDQLREGCIGFLFLDGKPFSAWLHSQIDMVGAPLGASTEIGSHIVRINSGRHHQARPLQNPAPGISQNVLLIKCPAIA